LATADEPNLATAGPAKEQPKFNPGAEVLDDDFDLAQLMEEYENGGFDKGLEPTVWPATVAMAAEATGADAAAATAGPVDWDSLFGEELPAAGMEFALPEEPLD
jgi:hypothetical protein